MQTLFVAGYPWWSLSDPLITFLKHCRLRKRACGIAAVPLLPFARESFPPETEMGDSPLFQADTLREAVATALTSLDARATIVFLDDHALEAGLSLDLGSRRLLYYSMELPPDGKPPTAEAAARLAATHGVIIQDADRLEALRGFYGPQPRAAWLVPNAGLAACDYEITPPPDLSCLEGEDYLLLTGSLIREHAVMETVEAFLAAPRGMRLVVNGWGELASRLGELAAARPELVLSTRFRPGAEVRWLMAHCAAGIVAYANDGANHRLCGLSSGKLLWFARFGKPILHNGNESLCRLSRAHGFGLPFEREFPIEALRREAPVRGAASRKFFETFSRQAMDGLDAVFSGQPCAS